MRLFPSLRINAETLLLPAKSRVPPENIVHIPSNYNLVFARNFKILHPDKPLPVNIDSTSWARAKEYEKIIIKISFDTFINTELNEYLNKIGANKIILCGLLTSVCVLFTAQSAFASG